MRTQQDRTIRGYNLHICDTADCDEDGWPIVAPTDTIPNRLMTFCVAGGDKDGYAHFFIDDYRFERLWNRPETYIEVLRRYRGVLSPDFSTYADMPYPMQAWNCYRSRALASFWQREGIDVIPTLQWSDERSLDEFAFNGLPEGGTVAVSTVGVARNREAAARFREGLETAVQVLTPKTLLLYGGAKVDTSWLDGITQVVTYPNDNSARVKANVAEAEKKS